MSHGSPEYPAKRMRYLIETAGAAHPLRRGTRAANRRAGACDSGRSLRRAAATPRPARPDPAPGRRTAGRGDPARASYVIYTRDRPGSRKAWVVTHATSCDFSRGRAAVRVRRERVWTLFHASAGAGFHISTREIEGGRVKSVQTSLASNANSGAARRGESQDVGVVTTTPFGFRSNPEV